MRTNPLRERWRAGRPVVNGWLGIPCGFSAEVMAHQGFDSLTIDLQHGMIESGDALELLTAISTTATAPVVRIPWLEPAIVMKLLDMGAHGLICPMVNTREDAERFVHLTSYPPRGGRSYGPARALMVSGPDYVARADAEIVRFAMIETREAMDNLDAILSVQGLDAVYVGPSDLAMSFGEPLSFDDPAPVVAEAIAAIAAKAREHGVIAGIHCGGGAGARRRVDQGYQFVTVAMDYRLLATGAKQEIAAMEGGSTGGGEGGY